MSHAEKHKPDRRTPQQLAKAILDHELTPSSSVRMTFREQLLHDHLTKYEKKHAAKILWGLKRLEGAETPDEMILRDFRYGLFVIAAYKKESAGLKNMNEAQANPDSGPATPDKEKIQRLIETGVLNPSTEHQKEDCEDLTRDYAIEISNLNRIEKLMHTLAKKLHIELIEPPGQAKGR